MLKGENDYPIEPWWFWGCSRQSYRESFTKPCKTSDDWGGSGMRIQYILDHQDY